MRTLSLAILAFMLPATAPLAAQTLHRADLDGGQEVPPVATSAAGWGTFTLNANGTLSYLVRTAGLNGTAAHIHEAPAGQNGNIVFTLSGGPATWSGTTAALTSAQMASLRSGGWYVNVHTASNPGGEIRGQIQPRPASCAALLQGSQENPPVNTSAGGAGTFVVNPDRTITYNVTTTGLTGTAAHIHTGNPGVNGRILFTLAGGPTLWSGTTSAMTADQYSTMQAGGLYVNVHTAANPGGEIRGQIFPVGIPYGKSCPRPGGAAGTPALSQTGAPMETELIQLTLTGGTPNGTGVIQASLNPDAVLSSGCPLWIAMPFVRQVNITLDASGSRTVSTRLPSVARDLPVYVQFTGTQAGTTYRANALAITIQQL